jgi:uncharacterized cupredoxin-like copper-binding protein
MNRKHIVTLIMAGIFPAMALAGGDHANGHEMKNHDMKGHDMSAMRKDGHSAAIGKPGDPAKVDRTIDVTMDDNMRFTPSSIQVKAGETIRFFAKNAGKLPHEMVLGTMKDLKEHAEMMRKMPGMQHNDPNMVHLNPGQRGGIVWQFTHAGTVDFACTVPGHMEAGMAGKVSVTQ